MFVLDSLLPNRLSLLPRTEELVEVVFSMFGGPILTTSTKFEGNTPTLPLKFPFHQPEVMKLENFK